MNYAYPIVYGVAEIGADGLLNDLWQVAFGVAGIGAIASFVFWSIFKGWFSLAIFQTMTRVQQYQLFRLVFILTFLFGILGLGAYIYVQTLSSTSARKEYQAYVDEIHSTNRQRITKVLSQIESGKVDAEMVAQVKEQLEDLDSTTENLRITVANDQLTASAENRRRYNEGIDEIKKAGEQIYDNKGSGGGGGKNVFGGLRMVMDKRHDL